MDRLKDLGVNLWYRYVDDVFSIIKDENKLDEILKLLNSQNNSIKFTIERENKNNERSELPFLDVLITNNKNSGFVTTIYRKKTFTGTT
jgi:hypothetical protein